MIFRDVQMKSRRSCHVSAGVRGGKPCGCSRLLFE
jgi:hypothetical protein